MADRESGHSTFVRVEIIAQLFGVTVRRIQQITQDGIINTEEVMEDGRKCRRYDLLPTVQKYVAYLSEKANGKQSTIEVEELKKKKLEADIALKESQGELHQLKTAIASGQYISVEEVQMDYSRFFVTFKKFAMNLPSRIIGFVSGQLDPTESRRLEKDISQEINGMLESFVVAGTEAKPAEPKKPKRGRPKKAPD